MKQNTLPLIKLFNFVSPVLMGLLISHSSTAAPTLRFCDTGFQFKLAQGPIIKQNGLNPEAQIETWEKLSSELQSILEADKANLLPLVLQLMSGNDTNTLISSDDTYGKIFLKVNEALRSLNSKVSFKTQINILPERLCSHLNVNIEQREKMKLAQSEADKRDLIGNEQTDQSNMGSGSNKQITKFLSFSTKVSYDQRNEIQKNFELIGFSLNIKYDVNEYQSSNPQDPIHYTAKVSGGILISTPHNYKYPLNIPIQLNESPVGNLQLHDAYFENDPRYANNAHYVALNFEHVNYSNAGMDFLKKDFSGENPKMHVYFSDEFFTNYELLTNEISFSPVLKNSMRGLLINVSASKCTICDKLKAKLDLPINHIVLEFEPFDWYEEDFITKEKTFLTQGVVPKLRFPNHSKSEKGGIKFSLRADDGFTKKNKIELLSFYINGDSILNNFIGGNTLAKQGVDAGYEYILRQVAINASFFREFIKQSNQQQPATSPPTVPNNEENNQL